MLAKLTAVLIAYGPAGILVLAFIDSAGIPVASGMDALVILVAAKAKVWPLQSLGNRLRDEHRSDKRCCGERQQDSRAQRNFARIECRRKSGGLGTSGDH